MCAERPLLFLSITEEKFMSGLTIKSLTVSLAQEYMAVSSYLRLFIHLEIQHVLVIISEDGESAFHRCIVFCGVTITFVSNGCNPL
jgi:hypothetical protein